MKQQLNNGLLNLAAWLLLGTVLLLTGTAWTSWQYWSIMAMVFIVEYTAVRHGLYQGLVRMMEMPMEQLTRYKALWTRAEHSGDTTDE